MATSTDQNMANLLAYDELSVVLGLREYYELDQNRTNTHSTNKSDLVSIFYCWYKKSRELQPSSRSVSDDEFEPTCQPRYDEELSPNSLVDIHTLINSVNQTFKDKAFVCRVSTDPCRFKSIVTILEDPTVEHFIGLIVTDCTIPKSRFIHGTTIAILNPCLVESFWGCYVLHVTDESNIIFFSDIDKIKSQLPQLNWKSDKEEMANEDSILSNNSDIDFSNVSQLVLDEVNTLLEEGDVYFLELNFEKALNLYNIAWTMSPNHEAVLRKRSLCFFKLEMYLDCLKDAKKYLEIHPYDAFMIETVAVSLIQLKRLQDLHDFLIEKTSKVLGAPDPSPKLKDLLKEMRHLFQQRELGHYDMKKLYTSVNKNHKLVIADYYGPIDIQDVGVKGRGVVLTEDVIPGQLLMSCTPFASCVTKSADFRTGMYLLTKKVIEELNKDPDAGKRLYHLSAGREMGFLKDTDDCSIVDFERIRRILLINASENYLEGNARMYGLWIMPSYINNDCYDCNCFVQLYGNVRQIRSMRALKKGEELLISYREVGESLEARQAAARNQDFVCGCSLCLFEEAEDPDIRQKRDSVFDSFRRGQYHTKDQLKRCIRRIRQSFKDSQSPFMGQYISQPLVVLGHIYFEKGDFSNAVQMYSEFLATWDQCLGDMWFFIISSAVRGFLCFVHMNDVKNVELWYTIIIGQVALVFGTADPLLLDAICPDINESFARLVNKDLFKTVEACDKLDDIEVWDCYDTVATGELRFIAGEATEIFDDFPDSIDAKTNSVNEVKKLLREKQEIVDKVVMDELTANLNTRDTPVMHLDLLSCGQMVPREMSCAEVKAGCCASADNKLNENDNVSLGQSRKARKNAKKRKARNAKRALEGREDASSTKNNGEFSDNCDTNMCNSVPCDTSNVSSAAQSDTSNVSSTAAPSALNVPSNLLGLFNEFKTVFNVPTEFSADAKTPTEPSTATDFPLSLTSSEDVHKALEDISNFVNDLASSSTAFKALEDSSKHGSTAVPSDLDDLRNSTRIALDVLRNATESLLSHQPIIDENVSNDLSDVLNDVPTATATATSCSDLPKATTEVSNDPPNPSSVTKYHISEKIIPINNKPVNPAPNNVSTVLNTYSPPPKYSTVCPPPTSDSAETGSKSPLQTSVNPSLISDSELKETLVNNLRNEANKHCVQGDYMTAISLYTGVLKLKPEDHEVMANRSLCYLRMNKFALALNDAKDCLQYDHFHEKGLYRAGKAYVELRMYDEAVELLERGLYILKSKNLTNLLKTAKLYRDQSKWGHYDFRRFYELLGKPGSLDMADYKGPFRAKHVGRKGRGLVATRDIKVGDLLVCCKAFSSVFAPFSTDTDTGFAQLEEQILERLKARPEDAHQLYELWAGPEMGFIRADSDHQVYSIIDLPRIRNIIKYNCVQETLPAAKRYAIFIAPSFINNDCYDTNCALTIFGDACQIRAIKPIKRGEELLLHYSCYRICLKDFVCNCQHCSYEAREKPNVLIAKRQMVMKLNGDYKTEEEFKEDICRVQELCTEPRFRDYYLPIAFCKLGKRYAHLKQWDKATEVLKELLEDWERFGGDRGSVFVDAAAEMCRVSVLKSDLHEARRWKKEFVNHITRLFGSTFMDYIRATTPGYETMIELIERKS